MKKSLIKLVLFTLITTSLCAFTKPSIEGRAVVAQAGELPPGMYVKAHSFLPGDSVIITNLSNKTSVEVFVFETIDTGVAAIVSPEVAEKLYISSNSDSLVQLRKVVVQASIAEKELVALSEKIVKAEEQVKVEAEKEMLALSEKIEKELQVQEQLDSETTIEEPESVIEQDIEEPEVVAEQDIEAPSVDDYTELEPSLDEEIDAIINTMVIPVPVEEEVVEETVLVEVEELETIEPIIANNDEIVTAEDPSIFTPFSDMNEMFPKVSYDGTETLEDLVLATVVEDTTIENPEIEEVEELAEIEDPCAIATQDAEEDKLEDTLEDFVIADIPTENTREDVLTESPNVLVPTEEYPAISLEEEPEVILFEDFFTSESEVVLEGEDSHANTTPDFEEEIKEDLVISTIKPEELIDEYAMIPAVESIETTKEYNYDDYIVSNIQKDGERKYFVQLATYKDSENIVEILDKYSEKYPLSLVVAPSIEGAYQVVVGPLTNDEYTIVLERFKSYGYKDAFLRIAQ